MKTKSAATPVEKIFAERDDKPNTRPAKQWESFPQPADCSVKWDFEGLSQPPRGRDRAETVPASSDD